MNRDDLHKLSRLREQEAKILLANLGMRLCRYTHLRSADCGKRPPEQHTLLYTTEWQS
jgi:hypothetical protein